MSRDRRRELLAREFWTPAEAAFMVRRNVSQITRWIRAGELVATQVGRSRFVPAAAVREISTKHPRRGGSES